MSNVQYNQEHGFALILALIISSVVLAIGLTLLDVTVKQLNLGTTSRESEISFQAAAAGMNCLQRVRNKYPYETRIDQYGKPTIDFSCLDFTVSITESDPNPNVQQFRIDRGGGVYGLDWYPEGPSGPVRCIDIEMYVYDGATAGVALPMINGKTCPNGSICTVGFSRAYNRACGGTTNDVFTVQRELTAEF